MLLLLLLAGSGCDRQPAFDAEQWRLARGEALLTDKRGRMVKDLLASDTLRRLGRSGTIELLGPPAIDEGGQLDYVVRTYYGRDVDPEYVDFLVVVLDPGGRVTDSYTERR